jgi:fibro-slime domain-containing protein/uncharacterized repeat protein (TIGR01451 family)
MRGKRAPWLLGALFLGLVVTLAGGTPPPRPSSFFGTVTAGGAGGSNAAAGTIVSAWIGGVRYAETAVVVADGLSVYRLDVPGDLPGTATVEGGQPGQTIAFKVGGAQVSETGTWQDGSVSRLDLTAPVGPDLTVSVNDGATEASPGATLTYTITVLNHGPGSAAGILVRDTLSAATSFVSASDGGTAAIAAGGVVTWPAFNLAEGQSVTRTVIARVLTSIPASLASATNVATASDDGTRGLDPKPADNTASDVDTLNAFPDLVVDVDNGVSQVVPGQRLEYTITISNTGAREAAGILLRNTLPSGITFFAASDSGVESGNPPSLITWPAFSLAGGATVKRSFTAQVSSTPPVSTLTDTASATEASGTDSHPADNSDTDSDPVIQKPDLSVSSVGTTGVATDPQTLAVSGSVAVGMANGGNLGVSSNFALVVFEDRDGDGVFTAASDSQLGQANVTDPIPAGGSLSVSVPISGTVLFRDNRISAFVDSGEAIAELDETNNVGTVAQSCGPVPAGGAFNPVLELNWPRPGIVQPNLVDSASSPVVTHLTDDNGDGRMDERDVPSIIFTSANLDQPFGTYTPGMLRAIRGDTGAAIFDVQGTFEGGNYHEFTFSTVAAGDIDLDGKPEIITTHLTNSLFNPFYNYVSAWEHDGRLKWRSAPYSTHPTGSFTNRDNPTLADLDRDGVPEVVVGAHVFNSSNGSLRWKGTGGQAYQSAGNGDDFASGAISIVADLDMVGDQEVVTGNTAYHSDGSIYWQVAYDDGYPAVGNFDGDPFPEVVVVARGKIRLHEHDGTLKWGPFVLPGEQPVAGGPPTIADFDADGQPEIGVASSNFYVVYETDGSVKWQRSTKDVSSGMTGSTVFDFDGDGRFEVVYRDEEYLRIYRGEDGTELARFPVTSSTINEEPVVADVDRDGNAEILVTADHGNKQSGIPGNETNAGLRVFGEADDRWVGTRSVWNQHAYSVGNVNDDSAIPRQPEWSWLTHNTYRAQIAPDRVAFASPGLSASRLIFDTSAYPSVKITARIGNGGEAVARAGLPVVFHLGDPSAGGTLLGTAATSRPLAPGEYEDIALTATISNPVSSTVWVTADDDGTGKGRERECNEANNRTSAALDISALGLVLSMSDGQTSAATGEVVTYTLIVFNSASHEATGVVLTDELPAYTALVSADAGGSLTNGKVIWPAFTVAGGATATRTLILRVNDSIPSIVADLTNRATVADDGAHGPDPTPANNVATDTNHLSAVRAQAGGPYDINEGGSVTFDGTGSTARTGSIVSYAWDLNADGVFNDAATAKVTETYADEVSLTVALKVVGSTGESDIDTATLTVRNVAPVVEAGPDRKVVRGKALSLSATTFTDPGTGDTQTATVDWGDGTPVQPGSVAKNGISGTVTGSHVYSNDGTYTVKVCVGDNDGGTGCDTFPVKVSDGWILVGQANDVAHPGCIQLTTNGPFQTGAAWYSQKLDLRQSFDKTLRVQFGNDDAGADGQVFVLQNAASGTSTLGGYGVEIGYGRIDPSVSVEMDTYANFNSNFGLPYFLIDPVEDHIAVNESGTLDHRGAKAVKLPNLEDGQDHQLRVIWNAPAKTLDVHFDGTELLMYSKDLVEKIFNGANEVNWGLTSGTGLAGADHFFCETVACSDAGGPVISVGDVKVTEAASGTVGASFPVTLACVADHEVRVTYSTADASAHAGEDFEAVSGTVVFQPGETSKAVVVPVLADEPGELPEQFFLDLGQAEGGAVRYGRGVGSIKDFHPPTITFTGTIRDFKLGHPDFERDGLLGGDPGIVLPDLGPDRKPVYAGSVGNPATSTQENFDQWYRDVLDVNKSKDFSISLQPRTDDERVFRYSNRSFYPIDGELWDVGSTGSNNLFTYELHTRFFYEGGEVLRFFSDDDMWVFVNGKLAVDMGACTCTETPLNLDQSASKLGLVPGRFYDMDVFYAERHSGGAVFQIELPYAISTANPGRVQLSTPAVAVAEAGGAATVQVIRDGGSDGPATVSYATVNGTATAPSDYVAASGTITFKNGESSPKTVTIPIVNDAAIEGDETFRVVLSNPSGAALGSVPETVLTIQDDDAPKLPELSASKTAELAGDRDGDGAPSPGDELLYRITITNRGNGPASGVALNDLLREHTAVVPGSVTTSTGTIVSESPVRIEIGSLSPDQTVTASFRVTVDSPVPAGVKEISNQGQVNSAELPAVRTDDPALGGASDPTVTMITATPKLVAEKAARLAVDADDDHMPSPGDTLEYTVVILNTGNTSATEVVLEDEVPENTKLVTGESPVRVAFGEIAGGGRVETSFQVVIDDPIAAGVREIRNQGKVTSHELPFVLTDDPAVGGSTDETVTVVSAAPVLRVEKVASLSEDADGDKVVSPGDAVLYSITIANSGNTAATEIVLSDPIPDHTAVVAGTVQTSQGTVTSESPIGVNLGALAAGTTATVSFQVLIDEDFPALEVSNQATVDSHELEPVSSDDPSTSEKPDATRTPVLHKPEASIGDASVVEGDSGLVTLRLPVTLSRASGREIRIHFATAPGTATAGADYDPVSGTLIFAAGETSHNVEVPVHGDIVLEPDETLFVDLSNPVGAALADSHGVGTIRDDEICPGPELIVNGGGELRGASGAIPGWTTGSGVWQRRTANPAPAEGVAYLAAGAETPAELRQDVNVAAYAARIAAGGQLFRFAGKVRSASESPSDVARIVVEYRDASNAVVLDAFDTGEIASPSEWRQVLDERPAPAGTGWIRVVLKGTRFTQPGNDAYFDALSLVSLKAPVLTIGDVTVYEGTTGITPAIFPVRLSCPVSGVVQTNWATSDNTAVAGQDYLAAAGALSFAPGTTEGTVTVQVLGDTVHERHETFKVTLDPVAGVALVDPLGLGTIVNDDFCARSPGFWKIHSEVWPVSSLTIGAAAYDAAGMLALLSYNGSDSSTHLARQLVAAELNLRVGSDPAILPVVRQAHEILIAWPPDSKPTGAVKDQVDALKNQLDAYNNPGCTEVPVIPGN